MGSTIGLHMICGAGEAHLLDRCLASIGDVKAIFSQIAIVHAYAEGKEDAAIRDVAHKWGADYAGMSLATDACPYGDFAAARNAALDMLQTDYAMWLDADDILTPDGACRLRRLADQLDAKQTDVGVMRYDIVTDSAMRPLQSVWRERVWRRTDAHRWKRPVHECVSFSPAERVSVIRGVEIIHAPTKPPESSARRNLTILLDEVDRKATRDEALRYFAGRDLLLYGDETGVNRLAAVIEDDYSSVPVKHQAAVTLCLWEAYGGILCRPEIEHIRRDRLAAAQKWATIAAAYAPAPEPFVVLGDIHYVSGDKQRAIACYERALRYGDDQSSGRMSMIAYADEVPSARLSRIWSEREALELALLFATRAAAHNAIYYTTRRGILQELCKREGMTWPSQ